MIKLYEVQQVGNTYCGPSVVSAIAGITTGQAAAIIRKHAWYKTFIKLATTAEVHYALDVLGFGLERVYNPTGTLRNWSKKNAKAGQTYLVVAGNHWIVVQGRNHAVCGMTVEMVHIDDHPKARSQVTDVFIITKTKKVKAEDVLKTLVPQVKPESRNTRSRTKAKKLAKEFDIEIEKLDYSWMVYPPSDFPEHEDPHAGDHNCQDWMEVLAMVDRYVEIIQSKRNAK